MIYRWWSELNQQVIKNQGNNINENSSSVIEIPQGILRVGKDTFIAKDAKLSGDITIGNNCMIGTGVIIRGNVRIDNNVKIGYGVEIKNSIIKENTIIGPLCYIGDSLIEKNVYLGALVRTSNHRLDRAIIKSWNGEFYEETGLEKLGAWIKENSNLGIGIVVLPGRIIPENSTFSPHLVIYKNYSPGTYKIAQNIVKVN